MVYGDQYTPIVIITDNDDGLRNALSRTWPYVPSLLCRWHISKNILVKAQEIRRVNGLGDNELKRRNEELRKAFIRRWNEVSYAKTPEASEEAYQQLQIDYSEQPDLVNYLNEHKYTTKELFAEAWTSQIKHYGATVTSRIEGSQSCLKSFLGTSKSGLFSVVKVVSLLHIEQYNQIQKDLARSRDSIPHDINARLPGNSWMDLEINTKAVPQAIRLLKQQYELTLQPTFNILHRPISEVYGNTLRPYNSWPY